MRPQDELQGEGEAPRTREASDRSVEDLEVRQESEEEIARLRRENILLRARIVQMQRRLCELEKAVGGIKPYREATKSPDKGFLAALSKLNKRKST